MTWLSTSNQSALFQINIIIVRVLMLYFLFDIVYKIKNIVTQFDLMHPSSGYIVISNVIVIVFSLGIESFSVKNEHREGLCWLTSFSKNSYWCLKVYQHLKNILMQTDVIHTSSDCIFNRYLIVFNLRTSIERACVGWPAFKKDILKIYWCNQMWYIKWSYFH